MGADRSIEKIQKLTEKKKSEKIEKFLNDKDIEVVKAAIVGLGMIQDETSVNLLSKLIDHEDPEIRKTAIVAFAKNKTEYSRTFIQHRLSKEADAGVKEVASKTLREYKAV